MFVTAGNITLAVDVVGDGPRPMVFLHGWLMSKESWAPLLPHLSWHDYRAYLVDVRGFGASAKPPSGYAIEDYARDTIRLIRRLNIAPVVLVGHSFGGAGSLFVAAKLRHYVDALIVMDTFPGGAAPSSAGRTRHHLERVQQLLNRTPESKRMQVLNRIWLQAFYQKPDDRAMVLQDQASRAILPHVLEQTIHTNLTTDIERLLPHIQCPTLVIRGKYDRMLAPGDDPLKKIPHAEFAIIPDAGHYPMIEQPKLVGAAMENFLQRHSQRVDKPWR
ncbi:hypothetical protein BXT84_12230 [Sulfobacillus thermotolerans]|uniref:AB hydrolase-1 domain-containing protein n=1 Tax=Sulfobacillus thermotolerans TaxID=338644 RepID=A0ABM6RT49_9FIRM|nr:hypothetical protein BXT84_12230 [Sulfobacillus thermotolerans]